MRDEKLVFQIDTELRGKARTLRRNSTNAERLLWARLRDHGLDGFSFRRQVPLAGYIADFVCHAAKLVIELDGGQHYTDEGERSDAARSAALSAKGFRVVRFGNHDVLQNRDGVLETIRAALPRKEPPP
jgi:very-short-patch-repair endonuclease